MENNLIACHAQGNIGTVLIEVDAGDAYIVETCNDAGFCLWYKRLDTLDEAWEEYDRQKNNPENPYECS